MYDVIIIGGGAAGMSAAARAAEYGKKVLIIEKNKMLGRKMLITGKGRCNITNIADTDELMKNVTANGRFLYSAFSNCGTADVISFFEGLGVELKTERGGRVFPKSDKAGDVVHAMREYLQKLGVQIKTAEVRDVIVSNGEVKGVRTAFGDIPASSVIIATGGMSYPLTGSTGDGYRFAKNLGHTITTPRASLVPVETEEKWVHELQGLSLKNVKLTLLYKGKKVFEDLGEMLFTHFGVSGPLVLSASCHMKGDIDDYQIAVDLKPALDLQTLDKRLLRDFQENINRDFANSLSKLLPSKLIPVIISLSKIAPHTKVNSITKEQRAQLTSLLKNLAMQARALRPIDEAIITSGGVCTKEINPSTMQSKLVKNLFFAGEVIDVDAYTGGFNLQIAFSTGFLAGECC